MSGHRILVGQHLVELHRPLRAAPRGWHRLWESVTASDPGGDKVTGPRVQVGRMWNTRWCSLWIRAHNPLLGRGTGIPGR